MKRKYMSNTYMKGVSDWELVIIKKEKEKYYITIKKINIIDKAFTIKDKVLIDNGYYIIEFTPLDQFYNVRVFIDKNSKLVGYYFDIVASNGEENNIPYYDDLYLDVIYFPDDNFIKIDDENELLEALNDKKTTQEQYDLAYNTCNKLVNEIKEKQNVFVNMDKKELLEKFSRK